MLTTPINTIARISTGKWFIYQAYAFLFIWVWPIHCSILVFTAIIATSSSRKSTKSIYHIFRTNLGCSFWSATKSYVADRKNNKWHQQDPFVKVLHFSLLPSYVVWPDCYLSISVILISALNKLKTADRSPRNSRMSVMKSLRLATNNDDNCFHLFMNQV